MENGARHIVVAVNDDFRVRESLESLIESAGYEALLFSSAEEFLLLGAVAAAACVITGVRMEAMDGIELQHRTRPDHPAVSVAFITAHENSDEIRRQAFDEGAVAFLYKPFNAADLLERMQAAPASNREK